MSSSRDEQIARLGAAIDELAVTVRSQPPGEAGLGELAGRVADIWAMIADLDPAVAARMPRYDTGIPHP